MLHRNSNQVTIQRVDGAQFTLPLDRLSAADQQWVREQR